MFLPLMCFRTADGTSIRIAVVSLTSLNSFRFAGELTEICLVSNPQLPRMFFGVNLMVKSGIMGLVVVDIILIHKISLSNKILMQSAYCILGQNLLCFLRLMCRISIVDSTRETH